ncbi:MAG: ATP-binding cassette domain-containing protein [Lentisphaeria bacterium]|nr:ATP-binding cassette domain-containing protein [Lentisphaeria bacterium]
MSNAIIQVSGLEVHTSEGVLLDSLDFTVDQGEIVVVLGASGCGKTTLLRHIIGLSPPSAGEVLIGGQSIVHGDNDVRETIMRSFGVLYQSGALFGSMTLLENVCLPFEEHTDLPSRLIDQLARTRLASVGLAGFEDYLPANISGGMKKRAGLARALALEPPILFLDEPSAGLDPISSAALDKLILRLRDAYGTTMMVVTHELDSIFTIADRALILQDKHIAAYGPLNEVMGRSDNEWIQEFFSRSGTSLRAPIPAAASAQSTESTTSDLHEGIHND